MTPIKAEKREILGKKVAELRKAGKIPAVVYGAGEDGMMLEISAREFDKVFREAGESSLVELEIGSQKKNVLIHEVSYDPIKDRPTHVDFLQVRMDRKIRADVEIEFEGESPAAKQGGILVKVAHKIEVEALPQDLPHEIKLDISKLENLEAKFFLKDLVLPNGVTAIGEPEEVLALIESPRTEEEIAAEEAAAAGGIETIEVVGKKEKEEGEEGEDTEGAAEGEKASE